MKSAVEAGDQASRAFLTDVAQLAYYAGKRGFDWLLDVAKDPTSHGARNIPVNEPADRLLLMEQEGCQPFQNG
jgi:hypothetical protein